MAISRKVHAHGDALWWLILLVLAATLTSVLTRVAN